jgi:hypothetical protein
LRERRTGHSDKTDHQRLPQGRETKHSYPPHLVSQRMAEIQDVG